MRNKTLTYQLSVLHLWLVGLSFVDIHLQKWRANRRLPCKSQAIAHVRVASGINPPKRSAWLVPRTLDAASTVALHCTLYITGGSSTAIKSVKESFKMADLYFVL